VSANNTLSRNRHGVKAKIASAALVAGLAGLAGCGGGGVATPAPYVPVAPAAPLVETYDVICGDTSIRIQINPGGAGLTAYVDDGWTIMAELVPTPDGSEFVADVPDPYSGGYSTWEFWYDDYDWVVAQDGTQWNCTTVG